MISSCTPMSYELYLQTHSEPSTCHLSSATRTTQGLHSLLAPTCSTESPAEASPCWESKSLSPTTISGELDPPYVSSPAPVLSVWSRLPRAGPSHQLGSCHLQPGVAPSLSCPFTLPFPQTLLCSWIYSSAASIHVSPPTARELRKTGTPSGPFPAVSPSDPAPDLGRWGET